MINSSVKGVVDAYVDEVLAGSIRCGELELAAVRRYIHDCEQGFWTLDEDAANRACLFFPHVLRHGAGQWGATDRKEADPFELSPWQSFVIWNLIGWRHPDNGLRRFRKAYISVGRKNGKTTLMAGLLLYLFCLKSDAAPELYVMGAKMDQSKILYTMARRMINASPDLRKRTVQQESGCRNTTNDGVLAPLSATSPEHGRNPSVVCFDELHEYQEHNLDTFDALTTGSGSRSEPLHAIITTAGDPGGRSPIWQEEDRFAEHVARSACGDNAPGERQFVFVCRYDKGDDFFDPQNFRKANPNLGVTVFEQQLRAEMDEAMVRPEVRYRFQRFFANYPVGTLGQAIKSEDWARGNLDEITLDGCDCYAGMDIGRSYDFSAFALLFPLDDGEYYLRTWTWACSESDAQTTREPFLTWQADNWIEIHYGSAVDFQKVRDDILEVMAHYNVLNLSFDKYESRVLAQDIHSETGVPLEEVPQQPGHYNEPTKQFCNVLVPEGRLYHAPDPCLAWQAANVVIPPHTRDLWMPDKGHKTRKVDAIMATLMAYKAALFAESQDLNYYESNEVEVG